MYSTKVMHKNVGQTYISIGDPYKSTKTSDLLPGRWKSKQLVIVKKPKNAADGMFSKITYQPDKYSESTELYSKTQPLDKRQKGFGSRDAFKRDEFMNTKATERWRSCLRNEAKLLRRQSQQSDKENDSSSSSSCPTFLNSREPPKDKFGEPLSEPGFLYDIGRTHCTPYTPATLSDSFYKVPKHAPVDPKLKGLDPIRRLGSHKTMNSVIGESAWTHKYGKPEFGAVNCVKKFYDRGHL